MDYLHNSTATYDGFWKELVDDIFRTDFTMAEAIPVFHVRRDPLPRPKSWRWYDRFRVWEKLQSVPLWTRAAWRRRLVQEPVQPRQRAKQKRRARLHRLYGRRVI